MVFYIVCPIVNNSIILCVFHCCLRWTRFGITQATNNIFIQILFQELMAMEIMQTIIHYCYVYRKYE